MKEENAENTVEGIWYAQDQGEEVNHIHGHQAEVMEAIFSEDTFSANSILPFNTSREGKSSRSDELDKGLNSTEYTYSNNTASPVEEIRLRAMMKIILCQIGSLTQNQSQKRKIKVV